jgi:uncharacterized membrane protein
MGKGTILLLLAIAGFLNALFLNLQYRRYKATGKKIFCLIGEVCGDVVDSKYGQTFGVKNELIGMTYYFLLFLYSIGGMILPWVGKTFSGVAFGGVILAAAFSTYGFFAQTFILRKLCSWCLLAIFINLLIFFTFLF